MSSGNASKHEKRGFVTRGCVLCECLCVNVSRVRFPSPGRREDDLRMIWLCDPILVQKFKKGACQNMVMDA